MCPVQPETCPLTQADFLSRVICVLTILLVTTERTGNPTGRWASQSSGPRPGGRAAEPGVLATWGSQVRPNTSFNAPRTWRGRAQMTRNRMQRTLRIAAVGGFVVASMAGA